MHVCMYNIAHVLRCMLERVPGFVDICMDGEIIESSRQPE